MVLTKTQPPSSQIQTNSRFSYYLIPTILILPPIIHEIHQTQIRFLHESKNQSQLTYIPMDIKFVHKVLSSFKHLLQHLLADPKTKDQALDFLSQIIKDQKFNNNLLQLLISALKSPSFMKDLNISFKELIITSLKNPQIKQQINALLINIAKNQQIKQASIVLVQEVFSSKESVETIVNLLKSGITNEEVKKQLAQSINFAINEVLLSKDTLKQLSIFIFEFISNFKYDFKNRQFLLLMTQNIKQTDKQQKTKS